MNERQAIHRMECLEAEVRMFRQTIRNLADAILTDKKNLKDLAIAAKELLKDPSTPR